MRMHRSQWHPSKQARFVVIKIFGNGRGSAGLGIGSASTIAEASQNAEKEASANMIYIHRYRNHTIAHTLVGECNSMKCIIKPKKMGYGERGPPLVKAICHAFGIRDYSASLKGRRNGRRNTRIRAIFNAFLRTTNPETNAEDRGQRLVEAFPVNDFTAYQLPRGYVLFL